MPNLIFFVGNAGVGKSTIASELARNSKAAYIDFDTITQKYSGKVLEAMGYSANDRDSDVYRTHLRDFDYGITLDVAVENLKVGQDVFAIGPFSKEIKNENWLNQFLSDNDLTGQVEVKVVITEIQDENEQKRRIEERQAKRDQWKLDHWDEFKIRLSPIQIAWPINAGNVIRFDNSSDLTEEKIADLKRKLFF
jgi:predicted kinase